MSGQHLSGSPRTGSPYPSSAATSAIERGEAPGTATTIASRAGHENSPAVEHDHFRECPVAQRALTRAASFAPYFDNSATARWRVSSGRPMTDSIQMTRFERTTSIAADAPSLFRTWNIATCSSPSLGRRFCSSYSPRAPGPCETTRTPVAPAPPGRSHNNRGRRCLPVPERIEHPDPERRAVYPGRSQAAVRRGLEQRSPAWEVRDTKGQPLRERALVADIRSGFAGGTQPGEGGHDRENDPDPMRRRRAPFDVPTRSEP